MPGREELGAGSSTGVPLSEVNLRTKNKMTTRCDALALFFFTVESLPREKLLRGLPDTGFLVTFYSVDTGHRGVGYSDVQQIYQNE